jgi:hypothetical protein
MRTKRGDEPMYFSIKLRSYKCPDLDEITGVKGAVPETEGRGIYAEYRQPQRLEPLGRVKHVLAQNMSEED